MLAPEKGKYYTYAEYFTWDDGERWELINGEALIMSAPSWYHQGISGGLHYQLTNFLKGKEGRVFAAPFDVRLNADTTDNTVLQPDIIVFCDRTKLDGTGCKGAPDMTVEILSPATARHDRFVKLRLYQDAGVHEYWIVDPDSKTATVYTLENGKYVTGAYGETDNVPVTVLAGCQISLPDVFIEESLEQGE